jgi:hypothetical protein
MALETRRSLLHLHGLAELCDCARNDQKVPALDFTLAAHGLTDRTNRSDDGGSGWVGGEALQRLKDARAGSLP